MKKQNKLSIKVRDLEPSKDVTGGRRRRSASQADAGLGLVQRGDQAGLGPFGLNRPQ